MRRREFITFLGGRRGGVANCGKGAAANAGGGNPLYRLA